MRQDWGGVCQKCKQKKPYLYCIQPGGPGTPIVSRECWQCIDPEKHDKKKKRKVVKKKVTIAAPKKRVIRRVKR